MDPLEIFLICPPGLQNLLAEEAREKGFLVTSMIPGGVTVRGEWEDVWRANLELRGAVRVLVRVARFHAEHLWQLDKLSRKIDWASWLKPDVAVSVTGSCRKSKIYHDKAAAERVAKAINEELGAPIGADGISVRVRIERDEVEISVDTSGPALHKRGIKLQVNKAPMRENLAAMFLRACGYDGSGPVLDPMCGSGTFVIEAAEIAAGLQAGRAREFAFERLARFDPDIFAKKKIERPAPDFLRFYGSDRDRGAVDMASANASRAGVRSATRFDHVPISEVQRPNEEHGLVIVNPPYGSRIGESRSVTGIYAAFGARMTEQFQGWRVGLVTSDATLAKATGLPFRKPGPVIDHGGIKIRLWQTDALCKK